MFPDFLHAVVLSFAAMFPIINPIGHAPMFYVMTEALPREFRRRQAAKASFYTFLILAISLLAGHRVLQFFNLNIDDLRIAGGLLIARAAWMMLSNTSRITPDEGRAAADKEDVALTPMATPILAGPGAMSLAIGMVSYGDHPVRYGGYMAGFAAIALLTWVCLRYADTLVRVLGPNAVGALNRILGFFILAIGVDLIVEGAYNIFRG